MAGSQTHVNLINSSAAQYRHRTAAAFAPFPWQPAKARSTHSLLHLASPCKLLTAELSRESLGGARRERGFAALPFLRGEPIPHRSEGAKTPIAEMLGFTKSRADTASARKLGVTLPTEESTSSEIYKHEARKATAVQILLYSRPIANMFSDRRLNCEETLGLPSKTK